MKQIAKMSDRELAQSARDIAKETADRANRKAAAQAILAVLKKHKLSVAALGELDLGTAPKPGRRKTVAKRGRPTKRQATAKAAKPANTKTDAKAKAKAKTSVKANARVKAKAKPADKRAKVLAKYKNPTGAEKWTGRGRAPQWVNAILTKEKITIDRFKADKRFQL